MRPKRTSASTFWLTTTGKSLADFKFLDDTTTRCPAMGKRNPNEKSSNKNRASALSGYLLNQCSRTDHTIGEGALCRTALCRTWAEGVTPPGDLHSLAGWLPLHNLQECRKLHLEPLSHLESLKAKHLPFSKVTPPPLGAGKAFLAGPSRRRVGERAEEDHQKDRTRPGKPSHQARQNRPKGKRAGTGNIPTTRKGAVRKPQARRPQNKRTFEQPHHEGARKVPEPHRGAKQTKPF